MTHDEEGTSLPFTYKVQERRRRKNTKKSSSAIIHEKSHEQTVSELHALVESRRTALLESEFYAELKKSFPVCFGTDDFTELVCYGLGSPAESRPAQWQLALALIFRNKIKPSNGMHVYDPVLSQVDTSVLNMLDITVISENEEGRRSTSGRTLFYMPHCGRNLYDNVLSANWTPENLSNLVIVGNRFGMYAESQSDAKFRLQVPHLHSAVKFTTCRPFPENFEHPAVFNDTCFHTFSDVDIPTSTDDIWKGFVADVDVPDPEVCEKVNQASGLNEPGKKKNGRRRKGGRNAPIEAARAVARGEI